MWEQKARQLNSYLHETLKSEQIDVSVLNKSVAAATGLNLPLHQLPAIQYHYPTEPQCFGPKVSNTNARIAYGLDGIPKLIKDLCSKDLNVQYEALNSLSQELMDHTKCYYAIVDFDVAKRFSDVMDLFFPVVPEDVNVLEKLVILIGIVATHFDGAKRLYDEYQLVSNLYDMIIDDKNTSRHAAKALYLMSSQPEIGDLMAAGDHLRRVLHVVHRVDKIEEVYMEMAILIERSPAKAMDEGCFNYLYKKIRCRNNLQSYVMKCFALLINCHDAQDKCDKVDLISTLFEMLSDDTYPKETMKYIVMAVKNALYSTQAMWRCREFWDLPMCLIRTAHSKECDDMQLWSIQALQQLTMMPSIKNFVRKTCKKRIKTIPCRKEYIKKSKKKLLEWLRKKHWSNISSESEDDDDVPNVKRETNQTIADIGETIHPVNDLSVSRQPLYIFRNRVAKKQDHQFD